MATLDVINKEGETVGQLEVADDVFNAPVKEHLLWEVVVAQRAAKRRGTASTKTRSEVRMTGAKLYRQKGTGNARHGAPRVNLFRGGGTSHGPRPRSYDFHANKKVRAAPLRPALSLRAQAGERVVVTQRDG